MVDRSDDIKQLFSHLGLNPGDYQELQVDAWSKGPQGPVQPAAAAMAPIVPIVAATPAAAPPAAMERAPIPVPPLARTPPSWLGDALPTVVAAPAAAPTMTPAMPTRPAVRAGSQNETRAAPTAVPAAADTASRWSLLQAINQRPPQPARLNRPQIAVVDKLNAVPAAPAGSGERATRRLFSELRSSPPEQSIERLASMAVAAHPPPAKPVPAPEPSAVVNSQPDLQDRFRRLQPETGAAAPAGKLRFKFAAQTSPAPEQAEAPPEQLGDVFSRLGGQRR